MMRTISNLQRHAGWDVPEYVTNAALARIMCQLGALKCVVLTADHT